MYIEHGNIHTDKNLTLLYYNIIYLRIIRVILVSKTSKKDYSF